MPLINLSTKGLNKLKNLSFQKDFKFIINKKEFFLPKILVFFISPKIFQLNLIDPTLNFFKF